MQLSNKIVAEKSLQQAATKGRNVYSYVLNAAEAKIFSFQLVGQEL